MKISKAKNGDAIEPSEALYALYNLSIDLKHNQKDNEFCRGENNEIIYFVDTNVVNYFVEPAGAKWHGDFGSLVNEHDVRAIVMMLCMEYVFSEDLLGNRRKSIYVTPWHRKEVASRFLRIHGECMRQMACDMESSSQAEEKQVADVRKVLQAISNMPKRGLEKDQFKELAALVANDGKIEPIEQMQRIFDEDLLRRPDPDLDFPRDDDEIAEGWNNYFTWHLLRIRRGKNESCESDARTISSLQWLADYALKENQRLVFITGDHRLAKIYREWFYSAEREEERQPKNDIVRFISQYLPQINLRNSNNVMSRANSEAIVGLFDRIQAHIELPLIPNIMRSLDKERYQFSKSVFERAVGHEIRSILKILADAERESIYFFDSYLKQRLPRRVPADLQSQYANLSDINLAFKIKESLQEKFRKSISRMTPEVIRQLPELKFEHWYRVPKTLRFPISGRNLFEVIKDFVAKPGSQIDFSKNFALHETYAVCAGLAIAAHQDVKSRRHAIWYAELCLRSCSLATDGLERLRMEANFLCALISRFLVGAKSGLVSASKHYSAAKAFLGAIDISALEKDDVVRVKAEYGALKMFMAAQYFMLSESEKRLQPDEEAADPLAVAKELLEEAEQLLTECRIMNKRLYQGHDDKNAEVLRHYSHNLAGIAVLRALGMTQRSVGLMDEELVGSVEAILRDQEDGTSLPPFLQAELQFFLFLAGRDDAIDRDRFLMACDSVETQALEVDRWQTKKMKAFISERMLASEY